MLVLCAVGGVQSQSLTVDRQMKRYHTPRIAFINKMDRTGADPFSVVQQMEEKLACTPLMLQIPIGKEQNFEGIVDLVNMRAIYFDGNDGEKIRYEDIPEKVAAQAAEYREKMLETLSLFSDELMETLLEEGDVDVDTIKTLIREVTLSQDLTPVMMGTAFKNKGVQPLLDAIYDYLPSPLDREIKAMDVSQAKEGEEGEPVILESDADQPLVAMAFKTVVETFGQLTYMRIYQGKIVKGQTYLNTRTSNSVRFGRLVRMHADDREDLDEASAGDIIAVIGVDCASGDTFCGDGVKYALENIFVPEPVIRLSVEPMKRDGADKLGKALQRLRREDPTFRVEKDQEYEQKNIAGMGQLHLEVYLERIRREYKVECLVGEPRVAYRESPTKTVEFNHKHKKQTGGSGQYAHIVGKLVPLPDDAPEPYEFVDEVTGGRIPKEYIPAVNQGFQRALEKGPLCECEVVGVQMVLQDGSYHEVDSSDMAFNVASFNCMRETLKKANMALLEPIMKLDVEIPSEFQGPVVGHLSGLRGILTSSEDRQGNCYILAEVPLASMFDYANELRSMTQGKGSFSMEFSHYKQTPKSVQEEVVVRRRAEKEEKLAMAR